MWANAKSGVIGSGQVGATTYAVSVGALAFWKKRLKQYGISFTESIRFGEQYIQFQNVHGLQLELVEREQGDPSAWEASGVTSEVAIIGGAILYSTSPKETAYVLQHVMGLEEVGFEGDYQRFCSIGDIGNMIDVKLTTSHRGEMGPGTVHHIAWRAHHDEDHLEWQELVISRDLFVTDVKDRNYFNAIYFREPGHILFEIATDPPGFAHDEAVETMGQQLMLPLQYEQYREKILTILQPIQLPGK